MKKKNKGEFDAWISKPIITDFDDNDCYKFFMQYAVFKLYPEAMAEYTLILRDAVKFPDGFADELVRQISYFENLRFTPAIEVNFKRRLPYFDNTYYQWLRGYQYDSSEVTVKQVGTDLHVTVRGYWVRTILWEVPLMATISELYFKFNQVQISLKLIFPAGKKNIVSLLQRKFVYQNSVPEEGNQKPFRKKQSGHLSGSHLKFL